MIIKITQDKRQELDLVEDVIQSLKVTGLDECENIGTVIQVEQSRYYTHVIVEITDEKAMELIKRGEKSKLVLGAGKVT